MILMDLLGVLILSISWVVDGCIGVWMLMDLLGLLVFGDVRFL